MAKGIVIALANLPSFFSGQGPGIRIFKTPLRFSDKIRMNKDQQPAVPHRKNTPFLTGRTRRSSFPSPRNWQRNGLPAAEETSHGWKLRTPAAGQDERMPEQIANSEAPSMAEEKPWTT